MIEGMSNDWRINLTMFDSNFPVEVSVTKAALDRISECAQNGLDAKIDIWIDTKCGKSQRLCTLKSSLFQRMTEYSSVFKNADNNLSDIQDAVDLLYQRLFVENYIMGFIAPKPRVENNSLGISSLIFIVPSFKIEKRELIKNNQLDLKSFSGVSQRFQRLLLSEEFVSLSPNFIIGSASFIQEFSMEINFSMKVAPNLLRMEMDYKDCDWLLFAMQQPQPYNEMLYSFSNIYQTRAQTSH